MWLTVATGGSFSHKYLAQNSTLRDTQGVGNEHFKGMSESEGLTGIGEKCNFLDFHFTLTYHKAHNFMAVTIYRLLFNAGY